MEPKFILIAIVILIVVIISIAVILPKRNQKIVKKSSTLLKELDNLNSQYNFSELKKEYTFKKDFPTLQRYSTYQVNKLFDEVITENYMLVEQSKLAQKNQELYKDYMKKVNSLNSHIAKEETKKLRITYKNYLKIENKLFYKKQLNPRLDSDIICTVEYTSPAGRNHHIKRDVFSLLDVSRRYEELMEEQSMSNREKERRKRERALLTTKLRYEILERDGFKCQICGRTENDGVKLHVDHIYPISKGGATIPENLRTLCSDCNLGKSNKI